MPPGIKLKTGTVSKERSVSLSVGARPKDILVFVPGTTDPINVTTTQHDANKTYWEENELLLAAVKKLKKEFLDLHVLDQFFSWSGDNAKAERAKAGERLRELIYARKGQPPVYKGWIDKPVSLHLIGHSHGGNVINEFTKAIKKNNDFPKQWKIKSITYLSTPFFSKKHMLHQLDPKHLHPQARIINVRNHFDLTQRVIADFTLHQLPPVVDAVKKNEDIAAARAEFKKLNAKAFDVLASFSPIDDQTTGPALWQASVDALTIIKKGLATGTKVIGDLQKKFPNVISAKAAGVLNTLIKELTAWATGAITLMNKRLGLGETSMWVDRYNTGTFALDLNILPFFKALNNFLAVDEAKRTGNLITLIDEILLGRIDVVDDTAATPEAQLPPGVKYIDLSVKHYDIYNGKRDAQYDKLVNALENAQKIYVASSTPFNRSDVVLRLMAQLDYAPLTDAAWKLDKLEYVIDGPLDTEITKLRKALQSYSDLLTARDAHAMCTEDFVAGKVATMVFGLEETTRDSMQMLVSKTTEMKATTSTPGVDRLFRILGTKLDTTLEDLIDDLESDYPNDSRYATWLRGFQTSEKLADDEKMTVVLWRMWLKRKSILPAWKKWGEFGMEQQRGSVAYLAKVSHSVSRQDVYKEVREALIPAFESGKNPGYKVEGKK